MKTQLIDSFYSIKNMNINVKYFLVMCAVFLTCIIVTVNGGYLEGTGKVLGWLAVTVTRILLFTILSCLKTIIENSETIWHRVIQNSILSGFIFGIVLGFMDTLIINLYGLV